MRRQAAGCQCYPWGRPQPQNWIRCASGAGDSSLQLRPVLKPYIHNVGYRWLFIIVDKQSASTKPMTPKVMPRCRIKSCTNLISQQEIAHVLVIFSPDTSHSLSCYRVVTPNSTWKHGNLKFLPISRDLHPRYETAWDLLREIAANLWFVLPPIH